MNMLQSRFTAHSPILYGMCVCDVMCMCNAHHQSSWKLIIIFEWKCIETVSVCGWCVGVRNQTHTSCCGTASTKHIQFHLCTHIVHLHVLFPPSPSPCLFLSLFHHVKPLTVGFLLRMSRWICFMCWMCVCAHMCGSLPRQGIFRRRFSGSASFRFVFWLICNNAKSFT